MDTLEFHLGGNSNDASFTIPPWSYSFSGDNIDMPACVIAVSHMPGDLGISILGDTFLREYVTSFNYKERTITLGKNALAPKQYFPSTVQKYAWFSCSAATVVGAIMLFLVCVKNSQRRRMEK